MTEEEIIDAISCGISVHLQGDKPFTNRYLYFFSYEGALETYGNIEKAAKEDGLVRLPSVYGTYNTNIISIRAKDIVYLNLFKRTDRTPIYD